MAHMQPPVPYADFTPTFTMGESLGPTLNTPAFPSSIPDLSTSNLLSSAETNSFFGFLDKFEWEFDPMLPHGMPVYSPASSGSETAVTPQAASSSTSHSPPAHLSDSSARRSYQSSTSQEPSTQHSPPPPLARSTASSESSPPPRPDPPFHNHTIRTKPLLSQPQKRLNHIMSEQKRRNAIRDGYATLTNMLAPAGAPVGSGIPTRGRPKGSGLRSGKKGSGGAKGKSGVLFRAVEYCKWLEEGCEALRNEVERLEVAAGLAEVR